MRLSLFALKQCIIRQLLDSVVVISKIIKPSASADNTYFVSQKCHPIIVYNTVLCILLAYQLMCRVFDII